MKTPGTPIRCRLCVIVAFALAMLLQCSLLTDYARDDGFDLSGRVHPDLSPLDFELVSGPSEPDLDRSPIVAILVRDSAGQLVQRLEGFEAYPIQLESYPRLALEDLNFDGFRDLRLMEFLPAGPNIPYIMWLYDPLRSRFIRAGPRWEEITSPEIDVENRRILSRWRDGATTHGTSAYAIESDGPVLVHEVVERFLDHDRMERTVRERRGGRMVETSREILTAPF